MEDVVRQGLIQIAKELDQVFSASQFSNIDEALDAIVKANKIVCFGAGRVGLSMSAFAKRLVHLGKETYILADETIPRLGKGDLLIIGSGSGETKSVISYCQIAKEHNLDILLFSSNPNSTLASLAEHSIFLNCPNKYSETHSIVSNQPMTTLFEQALFIFLDSLVLTLMQEMSVTNLEMSERHNVIE